MLGVWINPFLGRCQTYWGVDFPPIWNHYTVIHAITDLECTTCLFDDQLNIRYSVTLSLIYNLVIALANVAIVVSPSGIEEWPGTPLTESSRLKDPFSDVPTLQIIRICNVKKSLKKNYSFFCFQFSILSCKLKWIE